MTMTGFCPHLQHTLQEEIVCVGIGVHSGNRATLRLCPAGENTGIVFVRTDLKNGARMLHAKWDSVVDTRLCTMLGNDHGTTIGTIEHLMAALHASGIDNVVAEIDGPEIPIMDGSAQIFTKLIEEAGLLEQKSLRRFVEILKPVTVEDGNRCVTLRPSTKASYRVSIDFAQQAIRQQTLDFDLSSGGFQSEICAARTFGFFEEGELLRQNGLGRGCSLDNTIVIKDGGVMNAEGLRFEDEFVRHKTLDAIGDLALAGGPLLGAFEGVCCGHTMNNRLLRALFADSTAWRWVERSPASVKAA